MKKMSKNSLKKKGTKRSICPLYCWWNKFVIKWFSPFLFLNLKFKRNKSPTELQWTFFFLFEKRLSVWEKAKRAYGIVYWILHSLYWLLEIHKKKCSRKETKTFMHVRFFRFSSFFLFFFLETKESVTNIPLSFSFFLFSFFPFS